MLDRTTAGLLARHQYDDAAFPFAVGDWASSGPTLSLSAGRLVATPTGSGLNAAVRYSPLAARAKALVIVRAQGSDESQVYALAHVNDITEGSDDLVRVGSTVSRAAGEIFSLQEREGGVPAPSQTQPIAAKLIDTDFTLRLFADGAAVRGRDDAAGVAQDLVASANLSGRVGFGLLNAAGRPIRVSRFFAMADRYVVVAGVPTGGSAEVQDALGAVLASAAEAGGSATIDLFTVLFPAPVRMVVKDSLGAVLDQLEPAGGVWGGDTYTYTAPAVDGPWTAGLGAPATDWSGGAVPEQAVADDAWASYALEEDAGAVEAADATGNGRDLAIGAGVAALGVAGPQAGDRAYQLDATGDGLTLAGATTALIQGVFSVAFRARPGAGVQQYAPAGAIGFTAMADGPGRYLTYPAHGDVAMGSDQYAGVGIGLGVNAIAVIEHGENHVPARALYEADLSGWHHYVVVVDGTDDGDVRIYIDGVLAGDLAGVYRVTGSGRPIPFLSTPLLTVDDPEDWLNGFEGDISELTLWNRALTPEEIAEHAAGAGWTASRLPAGTDWS